MTKVALITGGSKGIGREICYKFAREGYDVAFCYKADDESAEQTLATLRAISPSCRSYKYDLSSAKACEELCSTFLRDFGRIDVLVNNAGISVISPINDVSVQLWDSIIATDLNAPFYLVKAFLSEFISQKSGSIINISSMWGISGASCEVPYSTAKAGLIGFTKALARELAPSGIRVNAVAPGIIDTSMNSVLSADDIASFVEDVPIGRIGKPCDVANAVCYLASDEASYITGEVLRVDGGYI